MSNLLCAQAWWPDNREWWEVQQQLRMWGGKKLNLIWLANYRRLTGWIYNLDIIVWWWKKKEKRKKQKRSKFVMATRLSWILISIKVWALHDRHTKINPWVKWIFFFFFAKDLENDKNEWNTWKIISESVDVWRLLFIVRMYDISTLHYLRIIYKQQDA